MPKNFQLPPQAVQTETGTSSALLVGLAVLAVLGFGFMAMNAFLPFGQLNPNCIPGSSGCNVAAPISSGAINVTADGKIGIGTTNPEDKLTVSSTIGSRFINLNTGVSEQDVALSLVYDRPGRIDLTFNTEYGANWSERMRLTNEGKVGIGTTTPDSLLTVVGSSWPSATVRLSNGTNTASILKVENDNGAFAELDTAGSGSNIYGLAPGDSILYAKNNLQFGAGGARDAKLSISSNGNIRVSNGANYANKVVCYMATGILGHCDPGVTCTCVAN